MILYNLDGCSFRVLRIERKLEEFSFFEYDSCNGQQ